MPRGDGTGPMGMGAMTGRAAGFCAGWGMPGYANNVQGSGFGMGYGRGRRFAARGFGRGGCGWRQSFYDAGAYDRTVYRRSFAPFAPDAESEKRALKNQADALQSELEVIRKRLSDIEAAASDA